MILWVLSLVGVVVIVVLVVGNFVVLEDDFKLFMKFFGV